jgi:hypothetical protein
MLPHFPEHFDQTAKRNKCKKNLIITIREIQKTFKIPSQECLNLRTSTIFTQKKRFRAVTRK